jgi:hypothetical protein
MRDFFALHHASPRWNPADRAESHDRGRENGDIGVHAGLGNRRTRRVGLKIPVRRVVRLPDAAEVGFAADPARQLRGRSRGWRLTRRRSPGEREDGGQSGGNDDDHQTVEPASHARISIP